MYGTSPRPIVLASASPRRRRLLDWLGVPFSMTATDIAEELDTALAGDPPALARRIAAEKAVAARATGHADALVLAFDTIVVLERAVLGKPAGLEDAYRMLRSLSGRTHEVITGCALLPPGERAPVTFVVSTDVRMRQLLEDDIRAWAEKGELLGCAGAYNIESHLASVELDECYQNVAGLPLCHLHAALGTGAFGELEGLTPPVGTCDAARCVRCELGPRLTGG